ncbi:SHOCT domain-containing protein [Homoserinibacter gongjuensis]|uniref:SHOCT domain-containing protein n=1 Tax=Homoserinibacter gongjuensis TaxID=1162968 RepID=A0ABQ6JWW1_9MICO|nr:SHOCT domain-containing protein [Homoserinibacter gongjuensis]GMA91863.1 hypothetical protein GCM10025869_23920 [Homoserinibacter gongjuensis]
MNILGAGFVIFFALAVLFIIAVAVVMVVMISRNAAKARELGHDPLTMQTELAARAMDSELLAPRPSLEARLAELDDLHARGVITADEHAKARAETLAGP